MKHYVLGFIFNKYQNSVLLVEKKRPEWQEGHWNGIGGKIEKDDSNPINAMIREAYEETGHYGLDFKHCITFVCPGGTVFVFKGNSGVEGIPFRQLEDEKLQVWPVSYIHQGALDIMSNLMWIIPLCLADLQFPIMIYQNTLGVK